MNNLNRIEKKRLELVEKGHTILQLSSGNPNEFGISFPPEVLEEGWKNFLQNPSYRPDPRGDVDARRAIALSASTQAENVLLTSGTSESYFHIFHDLTRPGDEILFPRPSYPLIDEIARLTGTKIVHYALREDRGWQIDREDLERKIGPRTRAIVLISPNNPTGSILHAETLREVLKVADRHHLPLISDQVFSRFIFDGKSFPDVASLAAPLEQQKLIAAPTIYTLNGISKTLALPGLKLGWIIVQSPALQTRVDALERSIDAFLSANVLAQKMLPVLLAHEQKFNETLRVHLEQNRNLALDMLAQSENFSCHRPEGGFYLFAKVHGLADSDEELVLELLERTNILVHPGYFYDYGDNLHILISLLPPREVLRGALEKIMLVVQEKFKKS